MLKHQLLQIVLVLLFLGLVKCTNSSTPIKISNAKFPDDFLFGVATSAYQIEGGHNVNGKGPSVWDHFTATNPKLIHNSSNGNKACDSYHNYKEDVKLLKYLGVDFYRFSISWSRILPNGQSNNINQDGLDYYNRLINELKSNGIQPMVTLYHWDLPKALMDLGGWTNPYMAYYFEDYANVLFTNFGDRVKFWITFNSACAGYGDDKYPPMLNQPGIANYLCTHVTLLAHAKVYHLYDRVFRASQQGRIGLTIDGKWYEPASDSKEDLAAAERARQFRLGSYGNPIFHPDGDYPPIMKQRVNERSTKEGFVKSRLPVLSREEVDYVQGTYDFLGLNIYTTFLVKDVPESTVGTPSELKDLRVKYLQDKRWAHGKSEWLKVVPSGVRKILNWLKDNYDDPDIIITENGFSDSGQLQDLDRINYYQQYLSSLLDAIHKDNVTVKGYAAWSLLDNFEWIKGYSEKFGLFHVDFKDTKRKRTAKASANWYKNLIKLRRIPEVDNTKTRSRLKGDL